MRIAMSEMFSNERQRGPRLRCFLGWALGALVLALLTCASAQARQLEQPGPIRISRVAGRVVNTRGVPVANAEIALTEDGDVVLSTRTDASGQFRFERIRGRFLLRVSRTEFAPATQELVVTDEIVTYLERKKLYIIVGPGACQDECSQVFTSKGQFEKTLKHMPKAPAR